MFDMQLSASFRKHAFQFGKCAFNESVLTRVVARERVSAHHDPVNIFCYMLEEGCRTVACFKSLKDLSDLLS